VPYRPFRLNDLDRDIGVRAAMIGMVVFDYAPRV
jgi:hypothetical protein